MRRSGRVEALLLQQVPAGRALLPLGLWALALMPGNGSTTSGNGDPLATLSGSSGCAESAANISARWVVASKENHGISESVSASARTRVA